MSFGPQSIRGASAGVPSGQVDFRLTRTHVVNEFHRGRLSRLDVCDAHPELLRAARNVGEGTEQECPICEDDQLVHVSYVFGSRMPPQGRCISSKSELGKLSRRTDELACYVVEVCRTCSWNHLVRLFPVGGRRRA